MATGATGKNWLFFGGRHDATDFLYRDDFGAVHESGVLNRLTTAFSRDQDEKIYVQDHMRQEGSEPFRRFEEGAYFFVCGGARRMAMDVDRALRDIVTAKGRMSVNDAARYVSEMKKALRYVRDVY